MEEYKNEREEILGVDFQRLVSALLKKAWLIALISVLTVVMVLVGTGLFVTPRYESAAMFYVNNTNQSAGSAGSISSSDLTTSRKLVDSYIVILNTRETLKEVVEIAGVNRSYLELKEMIQASAVNGTEIIQVTVTSPDPAEAEKIASAIVQIMPQRITSIIEGASAKVVDTAVVPTKPSSPNYIVNAIVSFLLGFVLSVGFVILREIVDVSIRNEEDVTRCCTYPILASVPSMSPPAAKTGEKKKTGSHTGSRQAVRQHPLLGEGASFAASEAYKLLRTKLQFSFADENNCHIIGLSSAISGEGKSLSAINLACALSQLNKKVILIDCDMRRPTLAEKLRVKKTPGLASLLTGQCSLDEAVQWCSINKDESKFHVISAGQNPPNPVELLSSMRMDKLLSVLRKAYDYVIIDLPPVGEVTDALAVAKKTDGMLLVVRQNYCDRLALSDAVRQFEFIEARVLGLVFNCTTEHMGKYGKHYYSAYSEKYENSNGSGRGNHRV